MQQVGNFMLKTTVESCIQETSILELGYCFRIIVYCFTRCFRRDRVSQFLMRWFLI